MPQTKRDVRPLLEAPALTRVDMPDPSPGAKANARSLPAGTPAWVPDPYAGAAPPQAPSTEEVRAR